MAAALRPVTNTVFTALHRLIAQPVRLTRPLCRVPPGAPEQGGEAKAAATHKNGEGQGKSLESQSVETLAEEPRPPQATEEQKNSKSELGEVIQGSSVEEAAAGGKQDTAGDKKKSAQKKLHDLLTSLASADPIPVEPNVQLSRPKARKKKAKVPEEKAQPFTPEPDLDPELVSATKEVAESLGGDVKETESELLSTLRLHLPETTSRTAASLSELFVGMKVERKPKPEVREAPYRSPLDGEVSHPSPRNLPRPRVSTARPPASLGPRVPVDLFGGEPLGIFKKRQEDASKPPAPASVLPTWERLEAHELQQSMVHPPSNAFVEMIQWTNEGKLWTFPVDNEIGLEEEKKVGFHEHVFLERHLEGWCPKRGPIRHFMELVCTGLSKNPYLTVERKQAHIAWYKNYFKQKEELLKEIGAIEVAEQQ